MQISNIIFFFWNIYRMCDIPIAIDTFIFLSFKLLVTYAIVCRIWQDCVCFLVVTRIFFSAKTGRKRRNLDREINKDVFGWCTDRKWKYVFTWCFLAGHFQQQPIFLSILAGIKLICIHKPLLHGTYFAIFGL